MMACRSNWVEVCAPFHRTNMALADLLRFLTTADWVAVQCSCCSKQAGSAGSSIRLSLICVGRSVKSERHVTEGMDLMSLRMFGAPGGTWGIRIPFRALTNAET